MTRALIAALVCGSAWAQSPPVSFRGQILPILERRCQACHQAENSQGDLSLAAYGGLVKGGKSGTAIIPGAPDRSLLVAKISGAKPAMPKSGEPVTPAELELIRQWIAQGGVDDSGDGAGGAVWWSFRPLERPAPPMTDSEWPRTPIDRFILAKLKEQSLEPSPEADRRTLIRRLSYDLHGLPPAPEAVTAFLDDPSPDAYESLVDRLLASPRYGERWGRHWLDVAHYGDTHGFDQDKQRPNAWRYRDYVIDAFNKDKPYERFVLEQVAGDALDPGNPEAVIATGFLAAGPWDFAANLQLKDGTRGKENVRLLDRDDIVATVMSTFTSTTVHCARCHDHKFDPIRQEEYYRLQAVFSGIERVDRPFDRDPEAFARRRDLRERQRRTQTEIRDILAEAAKHSNSDIEQWKVEIEALTQQRFQTLNEMRRDRSDEARAHNAAIQQQSGEIGKAIGVLNQKVEDAQLAYLTQERRDRLAERRSHVKALSEEAATLPEPEWVYAVDDYFDAFLAFRPPLGPRPVHVLQRGSLDSPGKLVEPGALSLLEGLPADFAIQDPDDESEGRLKLARWLTDPRNALTYRSIVNRIWHYHFGQGIVDTPNDFGRMGSQPSHPELLEWLAAEFRDGGGSFKKLHKLIVMSSVYRQASDHRAEAAAADGGNRFLWRMNRRRLDAESVRDSALMLTGKLDLAMGGPAAAQFVYEEDFSPRYLYQEFDVDRPESYRRSVYRMLVRSVPDPFMESLDCADPSQLTPKRNATVTAIQALAMFNDRFIVRQSEHLAARLRAERADEAGRIERAYELIFNRAPSEREAAVIGRYVNEHGLENGCRVLLNSNELMFVD